MRELFTGWARHLLAIRISLVLLLVVSAVGVACDAEHKILCGPGDGVCHCSFSTGEPASLAACDETLDGGAICCADRGFPSDSAADCGCTAYAPYGCSGMAGGLCLCDDSQTGSQSCSAAAGSVCCLGIYGLCACGMPCNSHQIEVPDCSLATVQTQDPCVVNGQVRVVSCSDPSASSSPSSGSGTGPTGGGGSSAGGGATSCTAGGPGFCGDKPELNRCNCSAACLRDSPNAGSGYSCHLLCKSDADCTAFKSTCQPFTASGVSEMECR